MQRREARRWPGVVSSCCSLLVLSLWVLDKTPVAAYCHQFDGPETVAWLVAVTLAVVAWFSGNRGWATAALGLGVVSTFFYLFLVCA